jgi:post-segregation antitoxin (ccd killing protein)
MRELERIRGLAKSRGMNVSRLLRVLVSEELRRREEKP